jgi:chemotaxis protein methyltransferase CheR
LDALPEQAGVDEPPLDPEVAKLEGLEIELLLEAMFRHYGLDFRSYAPATLRRRIRHHMERRGIVTVSGVLDRILHDRGSMDLLLTDLSVNVTAMFRDPSFFQAFRTEVVPRLFTYPFVRIWHAGCATGEEVYSMCILLHECGLLPRTRIYATDLSANALHVARRGIFPLARMQEYTKNYLAAGGTRSFSDYYTSGYDGALFDPRLVSGVLFTQHDLAVDASFAEFNVIVCRNTLIYFGRDLKERVLKLFLNSLMPLGVLCLGYRETLRCTEADEHFTTLSEQESIYRRAGG